MKKLSLILISFLILSVFSITFILADYDYRNEDYNEKSDKSMKPTDKPFNPFKEMIDILKDILIQLKIIAGKNETIIVEPNITVEPPEVIVNPEITVEGRNEMSKRGNIILREFEYPDIARTNRVIYVALPNGNCSITLSTECASCEVRTAKDTRTIGSGFGCNNDCSGTVFIDDEYYMIRIQPNPGINYNAMYLAYNCV